LRHGKERKMSGRKKTCPKCGALAGENDLFCVSCGANLVTEKRPARPKGKILVGIGITAIILVAFIALLQMPGLTPKPQPSPEWRQIITFQGSGTTSKTTETFYIPSDKWRIIWDYRPHPNFPELTAFSFIVYPEGETAKYVEMVYKIGESKQDATYLYKGTGNYYLKIITANTPEWLIIIEAYY